LVFSTDEIGRRYRLRPREVCSWPGAEDAAMTADSAHIQRELTDLRHHWDEAYKITCHPGETEPCHAERLDDGTVVTAETPWSLRSKIIDDYSVRPVPRMDTASRPAMRPGAGIADAEDRLHAC
jgi:hypothetical protein